MRILKTICLVALLSALCFGQGQVFPPASSSSSGNVTGSGTTAANDVACWTGTGATGAGACKTGLFTVDPSTGNVSIPTTLPGSTIRVPGVILSNTTYVIAPSGGDFTTVTAAMTALQGVVISPGVVVTLSLADGTLASGNILVSTAFGRSLKIAGQHTYTKSMTSVQSSSGSAGAWSIVINLADVANIASGDYVLVNGASGGSNPTRIMGVWPVTNVDAVNSRITVTDTSRAAAAPSGAVSATVTVVKSILTFSGTDGIDIWNASALILQSVVLVGDGTHSGISPQDVSRLFLGSNVGTYHFSSGLLIYYGSEANSDTSFFSSGNTQNGIYGDVGANLDLSAGGSVFSGNGNDGVQADVGSKFALGGTSSVGNGGDGFDLLNLSSMGLASAVTVDNASCGYEAVNSRFVATDIAGITASGNGTNACPGTTGSGNLFVLATSPALITPNLGIPSFVTLTNATGLPTGGLVNNAVTSAKQAVVNTRRTQCLPFGANNATATLADTDLGPQSRQYFISAASTLVEMDVAADAGTPNIILGRSRAGSIVNVVSGALATAASGGIACSTTGGGAGIDGATTCSSTLQNTSFNAGDWIVAVSGTAGGTAKEMTACLTFTVN